MRNFLTLPFHKIFLRGQREKVGARGEKGQREEDLKNQGLGEELGAKLKPKLEILT